MKNPHRSKLPSGKSNPLYIKWWRTNTDVGKAALLKSKESLKTLERKPYVKGSKRLLDAEMIKCISCKSSYYSADVIARGWTKVGRFSCICDMCQ